MAPQVDPRTPHDLLAEELGLMPSEQASQILAGMLPLPADTLSCGNRRDLFKAQRRHVMIDMGMDSRNKFAEGYHDVHVYVCARCARDVSGPVE